MIAIRPLSLDDAETIVELNKNTSEDFMQQWAGRFYTYPLTVEQVRNRIRNTVNTRCFAVLFDSQVIGMVELDFIEWEAKKCSICRFVLGEQFRGNGYGVQVLRLLCDYAFNELYMKKIALTVFDFNAIAYRCYIKAGFKVAGETIRPNGWKAIEMVMTEIDMMKPLQHLGTQEIRTERLILRRFIKSDYKDMYEWAGNPEVVKYLSYYPHETMEVSKEITEMWVNAYDSSETYNWAIEYEGKVIGNIGVVSMDSQCFTCHLGWQIDASYWNKGIMTEAAKAVIEYLFEVIGFDRIASGHDTRNVGSGRVMQKIGMTREGVFKRYIYQKDGSIGDKVYYAILKSEWDKQRLIL